MSTLGISTYEDGFRLGGPPSECSLRSKAQIDALFEDSRSICSSTLGGWYAGLSVVIPSNPNDANEEQKRVNSAVQARIEAMFASVEAESGTPGECAAAILPVKYMGAAPVGGRVASVRGLQEPLRQLLERMEGCVRAELEVSRRGLTFRTSEVCEKINPFRRIAVWSALRLRGKRIPSGDVHHAFLPLVGDQDQGQTMENKHADLYRTMRGLKSEAEFYPPIFAVVMRRPGAARLLECHAFACECEEDAIAAAATLYRALLADLDANRRRPRHANGVGCVSLASVASSVREPSLSSRISCLLPPPPRPTAPHPVRPPRTKKTSVSSSVTEDEGGKPSLQKMPRRKKKNSDVKAEDILEARGRRRDNIKMEKGNLGQNNRDIVLTRNEELQNSKNKMFSAKNQNSLKIEIESNKADKIYSARDDDVHGIYERQSNKYEKLYKRNNAKRGSANIKNDIYERNYGSYDLNRANAGNCELYSSGTDSVFMYDKINKSGRNEMNSIYEQTGRNKENVYSSRIEDADKIYSLGQEDIYTSKNNKNSQMRDCQEDISFAKNLKNNRHCQSHHEHSDSTTNQQRRSRDPEKAYSGKRVSRVITMDKPLRKDDPDYSPSIPEYSRPRVRRRSRAGSEPPVSHSENANRILQENALKRSQSDIDVDRGDLMTRVELPRRGSFLTSGSTRRTNNIKGGTPLGFTELFDEFRNQEGLTSVDDILAAIIDPEGMSFNDLKPLYKEFLLKLAATLTQDELYQRSASIMRRRRRPQRRRSNRRSCLLGRAIKRSVSRLKGGPTEFTSVIFPARRLNDSFGSSSSCDVRNNHRNRVLASRLGRRKSSRRTSKNGICHTTSEDSDTCRRLSRNIGATANRSSSGYVSCSECSYDSESCTCVSADKCYCSLSRRVPAAPVPGNTVVCACDTDSCSESNKCYCARKPIQPTILEQLRQKGIVPSESTLSRGDSPERIRGSKLTSSHSLSRNTDFLKNRPSPVCASSSDNLALDYDLFSPGRKSQQSSGSEKVLVVSARDTQGRLVYVGGAERDKKYSSRGSGRSGAHHEALSIKKSAEIAAVFGAGENNRISRRASNASSTKSSISLEAGLGYLP
ncbi:uncharacterized protein LOC105197772 isoform X2 [Solenopsis invicta]|uniref:uncharacterized protein LOC105197772 isoform X2 n=1 Tax=Solenopsis invicta TaxID=13686 RepID=UPI00193CA2B6|nr:uncharacterized protein LOC105197772 isoform X2 [Solenopsis invicta]